MTASLSARPLAADILNECGYRVGQRQSAAAAPVSSASPPMSSKGGKFQLPELRSCSKEEIEFRAYFLAMAVRTNHKMMVCTLAERFNLTIESKQMQERIDGATKILTCASLFLIGLESGGVNNNRSVMQLLFSALHVVEKMAGLSVKELLGLFAQCSPGDLNRLLCCHVACTLGLAPGSEKEVAGFVGSEFSYRKEISAYAFKQELDSLKEQVMCFL